MLRAAQHPSELTQPLPLPSSTWPVLAKLSTSRKKSESLGPASATDSHESWGQSLSLLCSSESPALGLYDFRWTKHPEV